METIIRVDLSLSFFCVFCELKESHHTQLDLGTARPLAKRAVDPTLGVRTGVCAFGTRLINHFIADMHS